jgi:hypothetical protein
MCPSLEGFLTTFKARRLNILLGKGKVKLAVGYYLGGRGIAGVINIKHPAESTLYVGGG